ncbi:MAG: leucine-rich repeat protein, partial [Acutalibacteraceae bacterium]
NALAYSHIKNVTFDEKTKVDGVVYTSPYVCEKLVIYNSDKTMLYRYLPQKSIGKFTLPDTVKTIGDIAFASTKNLKTVTLSNTEVISSSAFKESAVKDVYLNTYDPPVAPSYDAFGGISVVSNSKGTVFKSSVKIHVPKDRLKEYSEDMFFAYYSKANAIKDDSLLCDGSVATVSYGGVKYAVVENGKEYMQQKYNADEGYKYISIVCGYDEIPEDGVIVISEAISYKGSTCPVVAVKDYAFENCKSLKQVVLPSDKVSYSNLAFFGCENLGIIQYNDVIPYEKQSVDTALPTNKKKVTESSDDDNDGDDNNQDLPTEEVTSETTESSAQTVDFTQ